MRIGGSSSTSLYTAIIDAAGSREVNDMDLILDVEWLSSGHLGIDVKVICHTFVNAVPAKPAAPTGTTTGSLMTEYTYTGFTTDGDDHQLYYMWDWGDGEFSDWIGPYNSGDTCQAAHSWTVSNTYQIKIKAKDELDDESEWSAAKWSFFEGIPCLGVCGDANLDTKVNVSDAVYLINYVFSGGSEPQPVKACGDTNSDAKVNVSDAVFLINYVFSGGNAPTTCSPGSWTEDGGDCCEFVQSK